jgi:putative protease
VALQDDEGRGKETNSKRDELKGGSVMQEKEIGKITHYFGHISVGIIELTDALKPGDTVHIKGHSEDFSQPIAAMQVEHKDVPEAKSGDVIGIKVVQKVHPGDKVFKVSP